jgi:sodium/potassium-transporting ATPase subunit alpha
MAKSRVLVKNLSTIETLSCVNVIASDKTGTLTQNKMFVASAVAGLDTIDLINDAAQTDKEQSLAFQQLVCIAGLCNNAHFDDEKEAAKPAAQQLTNGQVGVVVKTTTAKSHHHKHRWLPRLHRKHKASKKELFESLLETNQRPASGDATDIALLKFAAEYSRVPGNINEKYNVLADIPFNSRNKWMMKLVRSVGGDSMHSRVFGVDTAYDVDSDVVLLKGAPDYLLKKSTHIARADGSATPLTPESINELIRLQNEMCINGQRVLLLCKRACNYDKIVASMTADGISLDEFVNRTNDFCVVGLVGIIDPPREGIRDVIATCREAGIRVFMVTGDYALTAAAIAVQIGIFTAVQYDTAETMRFKHKQNHESYDRSSLLLTGADLENLSSEDWRLVTPYKEIVFARTTPEQKLRTVKEFQRDQFVVGVTGDGVNDAPALKSADIGIAMGSGSEVAMEASELVLLDNNFASILIAIRNGRLVFDNLRKVILYLLPGGCFAELIPVLMSMFIGVPQNLTSFQMLVISLFTDMAPSLSLMMEKEECDLLKRPPRSRKQHLVDWKFLLHAYAFLGVLVVLFSQCSFFIYMQIYSGLRPMQIIMSFDTLAATFNQTSLLTRNVSYSSTAALNTAFNEIFYRGQTVTFASIVLLQIFGNLPATRTHILSFFQHPPWRVRSRNLYIFVAQAVSFGILMAVVYGPAFHTVFNTRPIVLYYLLLPLGFAMLVFGLDEIRKVLVRHKVLYFDRIGW